MFFLTQDKVYLTTEGHGNIQSYYKESFDNCTLEELENLIVELCDILKLRLSHFDIYFLLLKYEMEFDLNYGSGLDILINLYGNVMNITFNKIKLEIIDFKNNNHTTKVYDVTTSQILKTDQTNNANLREKITRIKNRSNLKCKNA